MGKQRMGKQARLGKREMGAPGPPIPPTSIHDGTMDMTFQCERRERKKRALVVNRAGKTGPRPKRGRKQGRCRRACFPHLLGLGFRTRISPLWLILLMALLPRLLSAQDIPDPPVPDDVPTHGGYRVQDEAAHDEAAPVPAPPPLHENAGEGSNGVMTPWELYAGSVYANTSPLWVHAEGLVWWMRGNPLPALATTSPDNTPGGDAGVLGAPGTSVLHGNRRVDDSARGGFRASLGVRLGHWSDRLMDSELQFDVLWVGDGQSSGDFEATSSGTPILARPYHNAELDVPDRELIAYPNVAQGAISVETTSDFLSTGALYRGAWRTWGETRLDWLAGYRYAQLQEQLLVRDQLVLIETGGTRIERFDDFRTWNEFHGADMGLQLWTHANGWTVEVLAKVALGAVARTVEIDGETYTLSPDGNPSLTPGGLLAMPTNMGRFHSSQFSMMPELTIRFRRPISRFFTFTMGYTILAVDNTARTGDQIDLALNPSQFAGGTLTGSPRPRMPMNDSTLWVQGLSVGLEW
ncbi:MAG: BBP7 family outer membrane beta-barrel protein [Pirellulaceae bacterium]